ncbi:MAG: hypothetical protein ACWA5Q_05630 [bacterium]
MNDIKTAAPCPAKVNLAAKLLYVVIALGIVQVLMTIIRHWDVRSPLFLIGVKIAIYVFSLYLVTRLKNGDNWVRWALLVLLIVNIPLTIVPVFQSFTHYPVHGVIEVVQIALYLGALLLLFSRESSSWFQSGRN